MAFTEILYEEDGPIGWLTLNRPDDGNMFTATTCHEVRDCLNEVRRETRTRVIVLTGAGDRFFCIGGRKQGMEDTKLYAGVLPTLEMYEAIDRLQKPVIAMVKGYAVGGGNVLQVVCDLTIAKESAVFRQVGPMMGSFDAGYGSAYLARMVGQKFAREIFFLGRTYSAADMHHMGAVNAVVPHAELEATALEWAREICGKSPTAQRMLKFAFNLVDDGLVGQQVFAGEATRLAYGTDEGVEGRDAFLEKRDPDWSGFPYHY